MSDPLKKYIQQAKHQFDVEQPDPDLFGKILAQLEQENLKPLPVKRNFTYSFQWMAVAASLVLLIVCGVFLFIKQNTAVPEFTHNYQSNQSQNEAVMPTNKVVMDQQLATNSKDVLNQENTSVSKNNSIILKTSEASTKALTVRTRNRQHDELNFDKKIQLATEANRMEESNRMESVLSDVANSLDDSQNAVKELSDQQIANKEEIVISKTNINSEKLNNTPVTQSSNEKPIAKQSTANQQVLAESQKEHLENESNSDNQNLKGLIKKGFFNFVSKKAKKWSGDALSIENQGKKDETILALHFKNEKFEFSKAIHF